MNNTIIRDSKSENKKFAFASTYILITTFLLNFLNLVYQVLMGNVLKPEDFGLLSSILALYAILAIPNGSIKVVSAKKISSCYDQSISRVKSTFFLILKSYSPFLIGMALIVILISPGLSLALRVEIIFILLIAANFIVSVASPIISGTFQGIENYFKFSLTILIFSSIKLILGVLFVLFYNFGIEGAILSLNVTGFIAPLFSLFLASSFLIQRNINNQKIEENQDSFSISAIIPILFTDIGFIAFTNIDLILIRIFFSSAESGYYAIIALINKAVLYSAISISIVMIPQVVKIKASKGKPENILRNSFLLNAVLSGAIFIVILLTNNLIIEVFFGAAYLPASNFLPFFLIISLLFGMVTLLINYNIALDDYKFNFPMFLGISIEIIGIILFHDSFFTVFLVLLFSVFVMISALIVLRIKNNSISSYSGE